MSKRIRTTLTLDDEVVNRAKELGINLSAAAERGIINYIKEIEYIRSKKRKSPSSCFGGMSRDTHSLRYGIDGGTDLSGFEPESEAPEASVISKLHYRPTHKSANPQKN